MSRSVALFLLVVASTLSNCYRNLGTTPEIVKTEISAALHTGDDAESIERYLAQRNLAFSYDRFSNRYQSIIRDSESNFHAITIYILLDAQKRYVGVEVRDSYTLP